MIFENKHGHKWLEKTSRWNDGRTMIGGWNNFCKVNDIYPDDVCLCALLPDRKGQKVNTVKVWKINDAGTNIVDNLKYLYIEQFIEMVKV